jgi:ectoine hydroxylase-related dioxygenase (phytanoyl-CoA dioxygenase family)
MSSSPFGPPPAPLFEATPSAADVAFFRENGFLAVERITSDAEIAWLKEIYEHVFAVEAGEPGGPLDRSGRRDPGQARKLTQVFHPEMRFPELLRSAYVRNARRYAAALMGLELSELTVWTHMIRKAPGGRAVTWHQDEAFWPPEYAYRSVALWLPMHDVPVEMGAMQFIPGSHRDGVRRHRHEDDPRLGLLTLDEDVDLSGAVACPLKVGGCTFHDPSTLHYTAPNATDRPRLAYCMTVQGLPIRRPAPRQVPWLDEHLAATGGQRQSTYVADGAVLPLPA